MRASPRQRRRSAVRRQAESRARCVAVRSIRADEVREIFRRFSVQRPEPKGELEHVNAFTLLVAVVLSAQATDAGVNKATRALFAVADTPQKMLALGEDKVGDYIRTIGLWRNKAKNVIALSRGADPRPWRRGAGRPRCAGQAARRRPQDRQCRAQHGVRPATPWRSTRTSCGIGNRIGLAPGKTPDQVEARLVKIIPDEFMLPRPPLADPARPLCLQGAQAGLPALRHRRHLQVTGKVDKRAGTAGAAGRSRSDRSRRGGGRGSVGASRTSPAARPANAEFQYPDAVAWIGMAPPIRSQFFPLPRAWRAKY